MATFDPRTLPNWNDLPKSIRNKLMEKYQTQVIDDQLKDATDQAGKDAGYERDRRNAGDTSADDWWQTYQDETRKDLAQTYTPPEEYTPADYVEPDAWSYDQNGPEVKNYAYDDYGTYADKNAGRYGNTTGPDLSTFDRDYFANGSIPSYLMDRINAPDIASPDFQGQYDKYLEGARGQYSTLLDDRIKALTATAAGGNRLRSGYYEQDTGDLARAVGSDFANSAKTGALNVLGLQASDAASRRSAAAQRASLALDAANFSLGAGREAAGMALERSREAERNRSGMRSAYENDRSFDRGSYENDRDAAESRYRDRRDTSRDVYESDRGYGRDVYESDRAYGRGAYENTRDFNENARRNNRDYRRSTLNDAYDRSVDRSKSGYDRYSGTSGTYYDMLTGAKDRDTAERNARAQRKGSLLGSIFNTVAQVAGGPIGGAIARGITGKKSA